MIIATQLRTARALLGIDQRRLTELSIYPSRHMEANEGISRGNGDSLIKLVGALDTAGIELITDGAVRAHDGRNRLKGT